MDSCPSLEDVTFFGAYFCYEVDDFEDVLRSEAGRRPVVGCRDDLE